MLQLTASSQRGTDTSKGWYSHQYILSLAKDALMSDVYKAELKRSDSLSVIYLRLVQNRDSTIADFRSKDSVQTSKIINLSTQVDNTQKQVSFDEAWTKALDKEFHKLKVKAFFHQTALVAIIGGLSYLLLKR
jgi:hypothetical protein